MSQENVEVVRRCLETYEADEDAWLQTLDPELEWYPRGDGHIRRVGLDAAVGVRRRWLESWDDHRLDVEEVKGGGASVVVGTRVSGRGKGSGLEVDLRVYLHFKLRNGKVSYVYEYAERGEALEAAGLME
jgi:ketosteroid isomerase-like protein